MGGLYFITAMKQEQINIRENLRMQKALAKLEFESGGDGDGMDIMGMLAQFAPMLMNKTPSQQPQSTGAIENGKT